MQIGVDETLVLGLLMRQLLFCTTCLQASLNWRNQRFPGWVAELVASSEDVEDPIVGPGQLKADTAREASIEPRRGNPWLNCS